MIIDYDQEEHKNLTLKLCKNGDLTTTGSIKYTQDTTVKQIKQKILRRLNLTDKHNTMRLFSIRGIEFFDYDNIEHIKVLTELFYSFGEDFNYRSRLNTLKFIKELGQGGFGTVDLMYDTLTR